MSRRSCATAAVAVPSSREASGFSRTPATPPPPAPPAPRAAVRHPPNVAANVAATTNACRLRAMRVAAFTAAILLALVVGSPALRQAQGIPNLSRDERLGGRSIHLTVHEGTNMAAALSPDGRTIAIDLLGTLWTM